ncbi:MAG: lysine-sensitive aspartokinase 3, partial [Candidatus Melainabacteria bacterium]|nr:lysine-sensitive aspartokinase 3 [Candidatus Melainabacteria bacterium]
DGMMTADPRIIPDAQVLPEVSFQEASELAYFGAKVLHPLTIKPAIEKNIPVRILNTLNPDKAGTIIRSTVDATDTIRAIASKKGITAIFISSPRMLMSYGFLSRIFAIFDKYETPIDLISTSEVSVALTIDHTDHLSKLTQELSEYGEVTTLSNVAIVSVVGSQFRAKSGIAGRVFNALADMNILMISGGASDINLSFVLADTQADKAVQQLHAEFFKNNTKHQPCA